MQSVTSFIHLEIISSSFIHVVACDRISFILWVNNITLMYIYYVFFIQPFMHMQMVSTSCLLWIVLQWTRGANISLRSWLQLFWVNTQKLLSHIVVLFLIFLCIPPWTSPTLASNFKFLYTWCRFQPPSAHSKATQFMYFFDNFYFVNKYIFSLWMDGVGIIMKLLAVTSVWRMPAEPWKVNTELQSGHKRKVI